MLAPQSTLVVPEVDVRVDGAPLDASVACHLHSVRIQQRLALPTLCELEFSATNERAHELPGCMPGAALSVQLGGTTSALFEGDVCAVEREATVSGAALLRIRSYDRLQRLRRESPTRSFSDTDAIQLARELCGELGLDVTCSAAVPSIPHVLQWHQSSFDFLIEQTHRAGLYPWLAGSTVQLLTLADVSATSELVWMEDLRSVALEANAETRARSAQVHGWNAATHELFDAAADAPRTANADALSQLDATCLQSEHSSVGECLHATEQASALAQAELDARAARTLVLRGEANGSTALVPGSAVRVRGLGRDYAGEFLLTHVVHHVDPESGYWTTFDTLPPKPASRPWGSSTTLGRVIDVADPDGLGRVRVEFEGIGKIESTWLAVVLPAAGPDKGLLALPDVDDRVVVLLPRHDPQHGVVLGGTFGSGAGFDADACTGRLRRYTLKTPAGQIVTLDDDAESARIEIANGTFIEFSPDAVALHAATDLTLEAPGSRIAIRGQRIDFEEA